MAMKTSVKPNPVLAQLMAKMTDANFPMCEDVKKYEFLPKIGQGTFGEVFKARHRTTKRLVALKRIMTENETEGFPITALREMKYLYQLKHENIVNLIEICRSKPKLYDRHQQVSFYLVFDFCEHDLAGLLGNAKVKFKIEEIKMIMKQILQGLYFIHENNIIHRDMKAANILLTKEGKLKIADFGLSRAFSIRKKKDQKNRFTNRVVTLWYRPPELLLGERDYTTAIDMWGVGCTMAELWTRTPIMQGTGEHEQLILITKLCGSITPETLPDCEKLTLWEKMSLPTKEKRKIHQKLLPIMKDPLALDLLDKLLIINPKTRIDCDAALNHNFFWTNPMPCELNTLMNQFSRSMFEYVNSQEKLRKPLAQASHSQSVTGDGTYRDMIF